MTAFARQQVELEWGTLVWELRSVNHRYLETNVRLPEMFRGLENSIRDKLRKRLHRGKVECQLRYAIAESSTSSIQLNRELIEQLIEANREIEQITGNSKALGSMEILRWPGVIREQEFDSDTIEQQALDLFEKSLEELVGNREREGTAIKDMLLQRVNSIREIVSNVRTQMPDILARQRQSLLDKITDLKAELEATRIEQEVALLAQKADVAEELDRLDSHLDEVERVVNTNGQKGRRLDFLMQELNREANTLSSKSIVIETTMGAVELKVLIEQMREQIQNVE
ncbi:MAG: YicC family protein [Sphingomonadales bacterium]|nr:YicC family protein [Sphingomonadales bacterium]